MYIFSFMFSFNFSEGQGDTTVNTTTTGGDISLMTGLWPLQHTSAEAEGNNNADDDDDLQLSGTSSLPPSIAVPT